MAWRANMVWKSQAIVSGRGSARLERTVRVREVGGSNPPAPTISSGSPWPAALFLQNAISLVLPTPSPLQRDLETGLRQCRGRVRVGVRSQVDAFAMRGTMPSPPPPPRQESLHASSRPIPARHEADVQELVDRSRLSHAAEQPRSAGRRRSRESDRVWLSGKGGAQLGLLRSSADDARAAP